MISTISSISPMSPFFDAVVSPEFVIDNSMIVVPPVKSNNYVKTFNPEPVNMISSPGSIVPPTVFNVKNINPMLPQINTASLIVTDDIFVPAIQLVPSRFDLSVPVSMLDDVCDVENIKNQIVSAFYYKFLDKWMYDKEESKKILDLFKVSENKVKLIENIDKREDSSKDTQEIVDKKVDFIEKNIISKRDVYTILKKFSKETKIGWCRLIKFDELVKSSIINSIKNKIKKMITGD